MIASVLIAAALTLSFFVTSTTSLYNGAWAVFFGTACFILLFTGKHRFVKNGLSYSLIGWTFLVTSSAFFLCITSYASDLWIILILPSLLYFSLMREDRKELVSKIILCCAIPLTLLACFISFRYLTNSVGNVYWPFRNPNNLAAVLGFGLVGFLALGFKDKKYWLLVPLFMIAVIATHCRTVIIASLVSFSFLLIHYDNKGYWKTVLVFLTFVTSGVLYLAYINNPEYFLTIKSTLSERFHLWEVTLRMIYESPFIGSGLGEFKRLYPQYVAQDLGINIDIPKTTVLIAKQLSVDYETARAVILRDILDIKTAGYFVHNEPLQFAQEMGIPALILFYCIGITAWKYLSVEGQAMLLSIGISSHLSFHLHLPSIMVLLAITLTLIKEESA